MLFVYVVYVQHKIYYVLQTNKRGVKCQEEVNLNLEKDLAVKKDSTGLPLLVGVPKRSLRPGH